MGRAGRVLSGGALVAFSVDYAVSFFGIEKLHPFDLGKMDRIVSFLEAQACLTREDLAEPDAADDELLALVHDRDYLASLHETPVLSAAFEVWVPDLFPTAVVEQRLRRPMRMVVGGTVLAARGAVAHGLGINLGGGFHHARPAMGHGFCIYNDVALAVHVLRQDGVTGRIVIIDTDVHQGDGNHAFFAADPTVFTFSMHQQDLFPHPKVPGDRDLPLKAGTDDETFHRLLDEVLEDIVKPTDALVIHVAGADVLEDDPLAQLAMTPAGLVARDRRVLMTARSMGVPVLHLLAGGYGPSAAMAQARSVAALLETTAGRS